MEYKPREIQKKQISGRDRRKSIYDGARVHRNISEAIASKVDTNQASSKDAYALKNTKISEVTSFPALDESDKNNNVETSHDVNDSKDTSQSASESATSGSWEWVSRWAKSMQAGGILSDSIKKLWGVSSQNLEERKTDASGLKETNGKEE